MIRAARPEDRADMERICAHTWDDGDYIPYVWDEWLADPQAVLLAGELEGRMVALRNNLGMYEVHVADFYLRRKAYVAAVNRANHIIKEYQRTPAVPHALVIMQEAYTKLGMDDLAADTERVFKLNYPNGIPVADYKEKTFMEDTWDAMGLDK